METRRVDVLDKGFVELVEWMGNDHTIVESARVSVLGESKGDEKDKKLIKYLWDNKHTSPFEQVEFRFRVKCPLFIARQWHRHRSWSYNEVSRRYTDENIEFYTPTILRKQSENNRQVSTDVPIISLPHIGWDSETEEDVYDVQPVNRYLKQVYDFAMYKYYELLDLGVCREQARMVLPQGMYTMFYAKVDLHNLLHFLKIRDSEHAQYEMRLYAQAIKSLITPIVPWTMEYFNAG